MKAFVLLNGTPPTNELLSRISKTDLVVCADGAYDYIKGFLTPDVLLGDYDSLSEEPTGQAANEVLYYPVEKDYTDGQLAVEKAVEMGADEIVIYGALGGRSDHFVSNLSLLYLAKIKGSFATIVSENERIMLVDGEVRLKLPVGTTLSLVPFFERAHILSTEGLKYVARDTDLLRENSLGISNVVTEESVVIRIGDQPVLLFITENGGESV